VKLHEVMVFSNGSFLGRIVKIRTAALFMVNLLGEGVAVLLDQGRQVEASELDVFYFS
jgi:hypothetical protein